MFRKRKLKFVRNTLLEAGIFLESILGDRLFYELEQAGYTDGNNFEISLYDVGSQGWDVKAVAGKICDKFDKTHLLASIQLSEYNRSALSIIQPEYYWTILTVLPDKSGHRVFECQSHYDLLGNRIEDV